MLVNKAVNLKRRKKKKKAEKGKLVHDRSPLVHHDSGPICPKDLPLTQGKAGLLILLIPPS